MTRLEHKIITTYWAKKVKTREAVNYRQQPGSYSTVNAFIKEEDLGYFLKLSSGNETTEFTVLLAIFGVLAQRYFSNSQLIFSKGIGNKKEAPLLYSFDSIKGKTFKEYLQEIKEEVQQVYKHAEYDKESLKTQPFENYTPFGFAYNTGIIYNTIASPFLLVINPHNGGNLEISIIFSKHFIEKQIAIHFLKNVKNWIKSLQAYLPLAADKISLLSPKEKKTVLNTFNGNRTSAISGQTLIDLFEKQATKTPENIAVIVDSKETPYRVLNEQSCQLAHYIRETYNVVAGDVIGVKLKRGEELLTAILAILKAGAAYVPIDTHYPEDRIEYIEKDSNCKLVFDEAALNRFKGVQHEFSKENPARINHANDLAYVIYTSGSTGRPKGVMITHGNVVSFIDSSQREFDDSKFDVVYAAASHCFDLSVFEMFYPLCIGKKVRILDTSLDIPKYLQRDTRIFLTVVPSSFRNIIEGHDLKNISILNLGGEAFPQDLAQKLLSHDFEVRNLYGPTETTVYGISYRLVNKEYNTIPIGKPVWNTRAYVLSDNLTLLPVGVEGKLYLSGAGVARGYLNRPELTAEKFIENPYCKGERMYDTGDLVRWLPDGNLEFLGRKDDQVKLRGHRIELSEIENAMLRYADAIRHAVVDLKTIQNENVLMGYYVADNLINKSLLRDYLLTQLPSYMVPTYFVSVEAIPLTPSGKTDRKALSIIEETVIKNEYVAARDACEAELIEIWQEILGVKNISIKDNFFELGGHSLMISQIINSIHKKLNKHISFKEVYNNPTIESLRNKLKAETFSPINCASIASSYPVTPTQYRLWHLSQLGGGSLAYQISGAVELKGNIHIEKFKSAFNYVVERHEILRTYFSNDDDGVLKQRILPSSEFNPSIAIADFSVFKEPYRAATDYIKEKIQEPHDLTKAPLFRASLIKISDCDFLFFLSLHHIIGDGWSLEVLTSDVLTCYRQLQTTNTFSLPELPIQFKDYAVWLHNENKKGFYEESKDYWLKEFQGELPVLQLPSFKTRPLIKTFSGHQISYVYPKEILEQLKKFSRAHQVTLFMTLMSGVKVLLSRYSNQFDITIGTPIAGRDHPDLENQIGLYINTLAIRTQLNKNDSFRDLLEKERKQLLGAYSHQDFPFDALVEQLNIKRDTSRSPLFDVMVVLQNQQQLSNFKNSADQLDFTIGEFAIPIETAQFDISFAFTEKEALKLDIAYNIDIYEKAFIENVFLHLENIFRHVLQNPDIRLTDIDFLTDAETKMITEEFNNNNNTARNARDETIVGLFEEQARKTSNSLAVIFEEAGSTYDQLNIEANQLAYFLREHYAIKPGDRIAIKLERNEQLVISVLGILKAGAAYVPIDTHYPEDRIEYIEKDSNCKLVFDEAALNRFKGVQQEFSKENPARINHANDLAYVIYTSGSTGRPKGVMITHGNVVSLIDSSQEEFDDSKFDVVYAAASHCFDLSVFEMFYPLCIGKKVRILDTSLDIPKYLQRDTRIFLTVVPSSFRNIIEGHDLKNISILNLGGEAFPQDLAQKLLSHDFEVRNLYGPTEATVYGTSYKLINKPNNTIPIGKPVWNTRAYVLSDSLTLLPVGVEGKLYLSGAGVARGYLNRPDLTAEKFIENPYCKGERMYDTGDLVRWLPDGNLEFLGRKDDQVKLRGHRIELGEIENALQEDETIENAVVLIKTHNDEKHLVGYLKGEGIDVRVVRNNLSSRLPGYMIPAYLFLMNEIPLMPNGKVDKEQLLQLEIIGIETSNCVPPSSETEAQLVAMWQEILGVKKIGITDDFFELGGHSLKATKLLSIIHKRFDVSINLEELFKRPTIQNLAMHIENAKWLEAADYNQSVKRMII